MRMCYIAVASSVHTQRWVKYFAEAGHDVHVISLDSPPPWNIETHVLPKTKTSWLTSVLQSFRVRRLVKEIKPDLLHAHYVSGPAWYGAITGFHPFVATAWGSDILITPSTSRSRIRKRLTRFALRRADLVTCDAEHMVEAMKKLGVNAEKISLVHFGVDTQKFRPGKRGQELREGLGIHDSPAVISLRSLEPIYDVESLVNSVPLVLRELPEAKFVIAGKGSQEERLKDLAESLGVSESIRFVGFIPNDRLPEYLVSVDVYVSTSLSDAGIAASTAEAMACGLPVVVTDSGENRKWVQDGINGFVVPVRDPESLSEKIIYLIKDGDARVRLGEANRKIIEERNDYYREMKKMERLYEELIEGTRRGALSKPEGHVR